MKVLWISNIAIPKIAESVKMKKVPVGGWMVKLADEISKIVKLTIAFPYEKNVEGYVDELFYMSFSQNTKKENLKKLEENPVAIRLEEIIKKVKPDVIHIHGTECIHSYIVTEICKKMGISQKVVVSIQGMTSVYERHYEGFLPYFVVHGKTIRDFYAGNIWGKRKKFQNLGKYEIKAIQNVQHVIGRTDWDKACTFDINPNLQYHFNNEMLRNSFYETQWNFEDCEQHSIFMSQATSPIKGLHLGLEAFCLIKEQYPDAKLYIAGKSYAQKAKWKLSYYEKYILDYIKNNGLRDSVCFTGFLDEQAMCQRYIKSNVFVSASSIENSPNSVCEAMAIGMPIVSSFVGGVVNLLHHGKDGYYYQADAPYMLAYYIKQIFGDKENAIKMGKKAREIALERHNIEGIINDLLGIYDCINFDNT